MRFIAPFLALFAAVVTAQQNAINIPAGGLKVSANEPTTITWTNPSSGMITIKLQQGSGITAESGLTVASGIYASALTATFTIPADQVNSAQYNFEIIDDTDPSNYNFSPGFTVTGATGTGVMTAGTVSATASASLISGSSFSFLESTTATLATLSMSVTRSTITSMVPTSTFSAEPSSQPTSITNNNGASSLRVQGGILVALAGAMAMF